MTCPQCGTQAPPAAKFCPECATPLSGACPRCGTSNPPGAKFCTECAAPLSVASSATPAAAAPVAERRLVTVLFADLVGFTPFAEERDAEEVRETLSRYFEVARETVERYGGTIEKFIGDAVMAVWGTPIAREDDAERAVRAALELVADVRALGDAIQARAGCLTGEAAVTIGATDQGMVAGDIVNTAARLQAAAEPGTVLVGESTMRAAQAAIAFEAAGASSLKGKASPVPAYQALRVVAERGGRNRAGSLEPPFVGREEELRQLKDQYHAVTREARPRLVSIMGPAGIGKSRLAWEFSKYTDGLVEEMWWHSGRSPAYGEGITFWALGEMIRRRAELVETDDEPTTRARVAEMLALHVPDPEERRWIEPAMLTLLGIGEAAGGSDQHFAAWRTFFERMATTGPVTLVFEDLHWADSGLLDFIDHLLEWTRELPIYIVTLARPELLERRPTWGAGKRHFTSIFLEPLPEVSMRELLTGLIPGLPEPAMQAIVARADGVPLYAVETVRMLVADGRLEERDGAYVPTGSLSELAIPDTLTALIASRLDSLDPTERALLQDAAVLGQSFTPDALAAVAGTAPEELDARLRALVRRELLVLRADPRAPDRGQYAFVQSLIREVAYNTLARADRKTRHLAAARFFESLPTDELAGALAGHYLAAHDNAAPGAEADALAAQARVALRAAADRARALAAHGQAARFLLQALDVTSDVAEHADVEERAGEALDVAGRNEDAFRHLISAMDARRNLGDVNGTVRAAAKAVKTLLDAYRTDEALAHAEAAIAEFESLGETPEMVRLLGQRARALFFMDRYDAATEAADAVAKAAERLNLLPVLADTLVTKGTVMIINGRPREGLVLVAGGGDLALANDLYEVALRAAINRGFAENLEDPRRGFASSTSGLELARRLGMQSYAIILASNACEYALRTGDWAWAERELASVPDDLDPGLRVPVLTQQVIFDALRGNDVSDRLPELERLVAAQAYDLNTQAQVNLVRAWVAWLRAPTGAHAAWMQFAEMSRQTMGESLLSAARVALWEGDHPAMRANLDGFAGSATFGRTVDAWASSLESAWMALDGRTADALVGFRESERTFLDLDLPWDRAMCAMDMVASLPSDLPEAGAARERAREIFAALGSPPLLDRLDVLVEEARRRAAGANDGAPTDRGRSGDARVAPLESGSDPGRE
jgi:class 3 adenylate cyclase/tetratricopeptide (TPR) repeat protein